MTSQPPSAGLPVANAAPAPMLQAREAAVIWLGVRPRRSAAFSSGAKHQ